MRPLVRRLLAQGVTFGRLEARLRELFVEVADKEFRLPERPQTDSRVALLTGINRKEVRRIRSSDPEEAAPTSFQRNLATSLVSRWVNDPRLVDKAGRPKAIPYQASRGPSFVALAQQTTQDVRPRSLLDGLVSAGAAEITSDDRVRLTRTAYQPSRGHPEALKMVAEDPPELLETMLHNVLDADGEETEHLLQQKIAYDNIGSDAMEKLRRVLRREAQRFLSKADGHVSKNDRDRNPRAPGGERRYTGVGVYVFERSADPDEEAPTRKPRTKRKEPKE